MILVGFPRIRQQSRWHTYLVCGACAGIIAVCCGRGRVVVGESCGSGYGFLGGWSTHLRVLHGVSLQNPEAERFTTDAAAEERRLRDLEGARKAQVILKRREEV
jgi:hypothetical protein